MNLNLTKVGYALRRIGWVVNPGVYVLVDGQYGSTGKGLIAGALGEIFRHDIDVVMSNAGPNSGHTNWIGDEKIVLKQLPTFGVTAHKMGSCPEVVLTAGAVIDRELLRQEIARHRIYPKIHPHAAMIGPDEKLDDGATVSRIASTGQGVGPALMKKMGRQSSLKPVFGGTDRSIPGASWMLANVDPARHRIFMEVSQGFSLGINSGFYPYTTSRECTPTQALADACLPAQRLRSTIMAVRTFPIRVGNAGNVSSGPCYNDQREIEWSEIGVEPELTTVTQRPRRLFTWSPTQFLDSLRVIEPDVIFVNFTNYLREPGGAFPDHDDWMLMVHGWVRDNIWAPYCRTLHREPRAILTGCGPRSEHVGVWER